MVIFCGKMFLSRLLQYLSIVDINFDNVTKWRDSLAGSKYFEEHLKWYEFIPCINI